MVTQLECLGKFTALCTVVVVMLFASSCRDCTDCTKYPPGDNVKICKKDYASTQSYNDAYRDLQIRGYDCE